MSGADLPSRLQPLPWQRPLWTQLAAQVRERRLSHAVLLAGPAGVGKRHLARALAALLLCEQPSTSACGVCRSCQQLAVGAQPDALLLSGDGLLGLALTASGRHEQGLVHWQPEAERKRRDISIDAARQLGERLTLSAHYGGARVALLDPADALNTASVNALLKTIEEPPAGTQLLLVSERPQALAATLRSRCQRVRLPLPERSVAAAWLSAQTGRSDADALEAAGGAPLRALALAEGDTLALRREWAELWTAVGRRRKDPVAAAATVERERLGEHLHWAWGWLHGLMRERVLSGDFDAQARAAWEQTYAEVAEATRLASGTANPQLLLESLLVQWLKAGPRLLPAG